MYLIGGYIPVIDHFSKNTFVLDEHRSTLVPRQMMINSRCDHALHYFEDKIYALGGMSRTRDQLVSLNSCEVYDIQTDTWSEMPAFTFARQQHSVCNFNDKFLFIFGGKKLDANAQILIKGHDSKTC